MWDWDTVPMAFQSNPCPDALNSPTRPKSNRQEREATKRHGLVLQYILALLATATLSWITMLPACCILHITPRFQTACGIIVFEKKKNRISGTKSHSCVVHFCQCEQACRFFFFWMEMLLLRLKRDGDDAKSRRWALVCKSV